MKSFITETPSHHFKNSEIQQVGVCFFNNNLSYTFSLIRTNYNTVLLNSLLEPTKVNMADVCEAEPVLLEAENLQSHFRMIQLEHLKIYEKC